jgi:GNAT superfamily N-acetyltransferase
MSGLRAMTADDVTAVEAVWHDAFSAMRSAYHLPVRPADDETRSRHRRRIAAVRAGDPGGSWVAVEGDRVVGFAQALRRGELWVLSLLAVAVAHQGRGIAAALLEQALDYGDRRAPGLIMASRDPRAVHRYVRAGFALHPAVAAVGVVRRPAPVSFDDVRPGAAGDRVLIAEIDRRLRGAPHAALDLGQGEGDDLLVLPDRGYAVCAPGRVRMVAALDEDGARQLLGAAVAATPPGRPVDVNWITGAQPWAVALCAELGLALHPTGGVMVRGRPGPLSPYLPSGAFG